MELEKQKAVVVAFLTQCNRYADTTLERYRADLRQASDPDAQSLTAKIHDWTTYRAYNEHAIAELATDRLDDWFLAPTPGPK